MEFAFMISGSAFKFQDKDLQPCHNVKLHTETTASPLPLLDAKNK